MKRALVTGITGQDGSLMIEFLLRKGYEVYGTIRRTSFDNSKNINPEVKLLKADLTDQTSLDYAIKDSQPDEVYNFAAQSFVPISWLQPILTGDVTGLGVVRLLEAIRKHKKDARVYQASSSEIYGKVKETPQNEDTPFHPRSPYGVAKAYAHYACQNYRESYDMHVSCGIAFNHEEPGKRGIEFVTRKICHAVAKIKFGLESELRLGNLDSKRDWGCAREYIQAAYLMLQQSQPDDYVIATGEAHTVREFVQKAFSCINLDYKDYVVIDPEFYRPAEVDTLLGDYSKINKKLGWKPEISFNQLVEEMVKSDVHFIQNTLITSTV